MLLPMKNFPLARWAAKTGHSLVANPDNYTRLEIKPVIPAEMVFHVYRDGKYVNQIRLQTSGTLTERGMQLPHVAMDREWFDSLSLEPSLPDEVEVTIKG